MPEVITNTSPLQYLFQIGLIELLPALYRHIVVPTAVAHELSEGRSRGILLPDPAALEWAEVRSVRDTTLLPLVTDLGQGEREVLAISKEVVEPLAILDDGLARRYARLLGIRHTGTLGVLLKAKSERHIDLVAPALDRLEQLRFRVDPATRAAVLKLANE